jgi:Flp pilus assembly protein TadG
MVAFMVGVIAVVGLVYDGGQIVAAQREADRAASGAARAAAQALDEDSIRAGDRANVLDLREAEGLAQRYLDRLVQENADIASYDVEGAEGGAVQIEVRVDPQLSIFPGAVGLRTGTAVACPEVGISETIQGCD